VEAVIKFYRNQTDRDPVKFFFPYAGCPDKMKDPKKNGSARIRQKAKEFL
jgi:hypothetical protein